jgi:hypothetical protein
MVSVLAQYSKVSKFDVKYRQQSQYKNNFKNVGKITTNYLKMAAQPALNKQHYRLRTYQWF